MKFAELLPKPRHISIHSGSYRLENERRIVLDAPTPQELLFTARRFQEALRAKASVDWQLTAGTAGLSDQDGLALRLHSAAGLPIQGYQLRITPTSIEAAAGDLAGLYYAAATLIQLVQLADQPELPCLEIRDWPDFSARGVMLDVSRDKVPAMETLYALVDRLSSWKINQLQLYTEHTFAYQDHSEVWAKASPYTGEEMLALDSYCRMRFVELVPNQNTFGHMQRWLKHPSYTDLAETHAEFPVPWGTLQGPFSLCPIDLRSFDLIEGLLDELLPHFSSRMVNVGCDETYDVGVGRSREACQERGVGPVYLDYLLKIHQSLARRGYQMQFWADMIYNYPELAAQLPKDVIALAWGYQAEQSFKPFAELLASAGLAFYVCPGTSSWTSIAGRTDNMQDNQLDAAENGLAYGASGFLNTDWGDLGHWQVLPISYPGFIAGAGYSWCLKANRDLDLRQAASRWAFDDPSCTMGSLAYDLGNIYRAVGFEPPNSSALFWVLRWPLEQIRAFPGIRAEAFTGPLQAIEQAESYLETEQMQILDAELVRDEFRQTIRLLRHACRRGLLALEEDESRAVEMKEELRQDLEAILPEYRRIWQARNRVGGLNDSLAPLEKLLEDY